MTEYYESGNSFLADFIENLIGDVLTSEGTKHVKTTGDDANGDGSLSSPWKTIAYAVDELSNGEYLLVHPGTYTENATTNGVNITTAGVHVLGFGGSRTKVQNDAGSTAVFTTSVANVEIAGFHISGTNITHAINLAAGTTRARIHDNEILTSGTNSITIVGATNSRIYQNLCYNANVGMNIQSAGGKSIIFDNDFIEHATYGIYLNTNAADYDIHDNRINGGAGTTSIGIDADATSDTNQFARNIVNGCDTAFEDAGTDNGWVDNRFEGFSSTFVCLQTLSGTVVTVTGLSGWDSGKSGEIQIGFDVHDAFTIAQTVTVNLIKYPTTATSYLTDQDSTVVLTDSIGCNVASHFRGGKDVLDVTMEWVTVPNAVTVSFDVNEV